MWYQVPGDYCWLIWSTALMNITFNVSPTAKHALLCWLILFLVNQTDDNNTFFISPPGDQRTDINYIILLYQLSPWLSSDLVSDKRWMHSVNIVSMWLVDFLHVRVFTVTWSDQDMLTRWCGWITGWDQDHELIDCCVNHIHSENCVLVSDSCKKFTPNPFVILPFVC